jgi:hypothetical protein
MPAISKQELVLQKSSFGTLIAKPDTWNARKNEHQFILFIYFLACAYLWTSYGYMGEV